MPYFVLMDVLSTLQARRSALKGIANFVTFTINSSQNLISSSNYFHTCYPVTKCYPAVAD